MNRHSGMGMVRKAAACVAATTLATGLALALAVSVAPGSSGAAAAAAHTNTVQSFSVQVLPGLTQPPVDGLSGISCPSAGSCLAVGATVSPSFGALIETLSGGTWTPEELTVPGFSYPQLSAVWCASLTSCIAVGSTGQPAQKGAALIATLSGSSWTAITDGLAPTGATMTDLTSLSCLSITSCVAAGDYTDTGGATHALFETLSGGVWTPSVSTDPSGATSVIVNAIQCSSATSCLAVGGWSTVDTGPVHGLLETLSGSAWTASTLGPNPVFLRGLSCPSAGSCLAVGNSSSDNITETLSGGVWTETTITLPSGTASNGLSGVSCAGTITSCAAVGDYRQPANNATPSSLVLVLSGGTWTAYTGIDPAATGYGVPAGIACPTITTCVGVGQLFGTNSKLEAIAYVEGSAQAAHGYWLVGNDGGIFSFGSALFHGSTGSLKLNRPVVGITPTRDEGGYWLVAGDGGLFAFGDAGYFGSIPGLGLLPAGSGGHALNAPIVGMVPSVTGDGYFMVGADGGVFAFGDARFEGSCPGIGGCAGAAIGVTPDATGHGYWLVTATGQVYGFGDAPYLGAPGPRSSPISSITRTTDGGGYWILDANGEVFAYGDAVALGQLGARQAGGFDPATAIFTTADGGGYWIATALGKVTGFGDALNYGDMSGTHLNGPIIGATGF